jgi:DNA-directed RNA polymerase specialized sigma24 family protein
MEEEMPLDAATTVAVRAALQNLPAEHRRAVQAVYVEGRTYEEAVVVTAIPLGSLKRYLRLGLARLREQLDGIRNAA